MKLQGFAGYMATPAVFNFSRKRKRRQVQVMRKPTLEERIALLDLVELAPDDKRTVDETRKYSVGSRAMIRRIDWIGVKYYGEWWTEYCKGKRITVGYVPVAR
jgi:hypothetical protein